MVPYNEAKRLITTAVFEHDIIYIAVLNITVLNMICIYIYI